MPTRATAEIGAAHQQIKPAESCNRDQSADELRHRQIDRADGNSLARKPRMRDRAVIRGEEKLRKPLNQNGKAEGCEDLDHADIGLRAHRIAHDACIDEGAEDEHQRHHEGQGNQRVEPREEPQAEHRIHGEHEKLTMGEIDHIHQSEDQREADCNEGIDEPHQQTARQHLHDCLRRHCFCAPKERDPLVLIGPERKE